MVKVESFDGDVSDQFGRTQAGRSGLFAQMNAGKRNIRLDLRSPGDAAIARQLARVADVVIENFRTGVMTRLGLGFEEMSIANPRLVLLSISGFGATSPESGRRAYAPVIHAESGALVRHARAHGLPLLDQSQSVADTVSGLHGAIAILAALRQRDATGRGAHIDLGMLDAVLASDDHAHEAIEGRDTVSESWGHIFDAPGGPIMLAMGSRGLWRTLSNFAELRDDLAPDAPVEQKAASRLAAIGTWLTGFERRSDLTDALEAAGVGWADVRTPEDVLNEPTLQASPPFDEVDDGDGGVRRVVRMPYRLDGDQYTVAGRIAPVDGDRAAVISDWQDAGR